MRQDDRTDALATRNDQRRQVQTLAARLAKADQMYPHKELDAMPHTGLYLDLLYQYERAYDAMTRADAALNGGK